MIRGFEAGEFDPRPASCECSGGSGSFPRPESAPAAPALVEALSDPNRYVSNEALRALEEIGEPALPALVGPVLNKSERKSRLAAIALREIGEDLQNNGKVCWWVIPRGFLHDLIALALLLVVWIAAARRFPKRAPTLRPLRAIQVAIVVGVPVAVAGQAVYYATTMIWSSYYLPRPPLPLVSTAMATTLSCMFLVALPGVWACLRPPEQTNSAGEG
ncbi:MAG: HEAT repeat domain-containing protein [Planctomycetes bacterium]|nr:HEAT repeat domain-containing protein [Planctomycetota bacterium]